MTERVVEFLLRHKLLPDRGAGLLAAVSGGADSMCLLQLLTELAPRYDWQVSAAHYHHGLRGEEADRDRDFVRDFCQSKGIPFYTERGDVAAWAKSQGMGTEEAGRELRYAFLEKSRQACGADWIATAHNADDNAETLLMNLVRGSGNAGLQGIPVSRDHILRPVLCLTREEIEAFNQSRGISWVHDSSNDEDLYTRNRIRHQVMPVLRAINPRFTDACRRLSDLSAANGQLLDSLVDDACRQLTDAAHPGSLSARGLAALPEAVALGVLRRTGGRALSYEHTLRLLELCRSGQSGDSLDLPGCTARLEYDRLVFGPLPAADFRPLPLNEDCPAEPAGTGLRLTLSRGNCPGGVHKSFTEYLFKTDEVYGTISVRPRMPGDRFCPRGRGCTKTLKKLMNESRLPLSERSSVLVLTDEHGILAVYPFGPAQRGTPAEGDSVLQIQFEEISHHAQ